MVSKIIAPYLWYLDKSKVDLDKHKKRIILNVLNYGNKEVSDWLFKYYSLEDIKEIFVNWAAKGGVVR